MDANLGAVLEQVSRDKGIDQKVLIHALEEAILVAAKRAFGAERDLHAEFNSEKGAVDLSQTITVVSTVENTFNEISVEDAEERGIEVEAGDEMVFPIFYLDQDQGAAREQDEMYGDILRLKTFRRGFGRIAAQTAKQVIIQRIRDAERNIVYNDFKDRKGELVTGIVRRFERGNLIIDLGRTEAILPLKEQIQRESYRAGDRIQAYVKDVQEHARGPQIVLSRGAPALLVKLFELEVPEIAEGIVRIESAAREPGSRAKIAVSSSDRDVDPVGACVGMKGSRVQAVVQELRGEKIDIVPWSEDPATFVCNALQPAEVSRVLIDEANNTMEIIVPDDQLSLAIGRKGQNVRLASQLAGWKLDIHSETRIQEIKERAWESLSKIDGLNEFTIQSLYNHGIRSARTLLDADRSYIVQFPGMNEDAMDKIFDSAQVVAEQERKADQEAREEADRIQRAAETAKKMRELVALEEPDRMRLVRGVGENTYNVISEGGYDSVEKLAGATIEELCEKTTVNDKKAKQLIYAANKRLEYEKNLRSEADASGIIVSEDGSVRLPTDEDEEVEDEVVASTESTAVAEATGAVESNMEGAEVTANESEAVTEQPTG